jgi:AcrR family transcriptional regulator
MKAALATFARFGYRRTSMEALAQAADMSRPALYQYFRNKETVFREMTQWALYRSTDDAEAAARTARTPAAAIEAILTEVLALHTPDLESSYFYELLDEVQTRAGDLWTQYETRTLDAIRTRLMELAGQFDVAPAGMQMEDAAALLFYGAKGISLAPRSAEQRRTQVRQFTNVVLRGLTSS